MTLPRTLDRPEAIPLAALIADAQFEDDIGRNVEDTASIVSEGLADLGRGWVLALDDVLRRLDPGDVVAIDLARRTVEAAPPGIRPAPVTSDADRILAAGGIELHDLTG